MSVPPHAHDKSKVGGHWPSVPHGDGPMGNIHFHVIWVGCYKLDSTLQFCWIMLTLK
jgi:hypothetical protein